TMLLRKLKVAVAVLLGVLAGVGAGTVAFLPAAAGQPGAPANGLTAAPEEKKSDKDKLQGKWVPVSLEQNNRKIDVEDANVQRKFAAYFGFWKLAFDGDKVSPEEGGPVPYTLAPTKKPKEIDIEIGGEVGTMKAIYEFQDDKLRLAVRSTRGERPADFDDA